MSCVPRATLQLTAEHAILMMLALSKRLLEADDAVRKDRWDRDRVRPDHNVAYNWAGISDPYRAASRLMYRIDNTK